jgi:hypothetical protein
MCVCVCVCMCVCPAWVCLVKFNLWGAHPDPGPAGSTPPNGGVCFENWAGAWNKSCSSGWVCLLKFHFWGLTLTPGPQGPPNQMGVYALRFGWGQANKSCFSGWVCQIFFYFWGLTLTPVPQGPTPPKGGICFWAIILKFGKVLFISPGFDGPTHGPAHFCSLVLYINLYGTISQLYCEIVPGSAG